MPNRILSARLAAKADIRQVDASIKSDEGAERTGLAIDRLRNEAAMLARSMRGAPQWQVKAMAVAVFRRLPFVARHTIYDQLIKVLSWGHRTAAANLAETLPLSYLRAAVGVKLNRLMPRPLKEAVFFDLKEVRDDIGGRTADRFHQCIAGILGGDVVALREDEAITRDPGLIQLTATEFGLDWRDLAAELRAYAGGMASNVGIGQEGTGEPVSDLEATKAMFAKLLFRPISPERVNAIVFGVDGDTSEPWELRWARASKLAPPEQLAQTVANGYAAGKSPREIAKDLLPVVNNVRTSATRIARTECLRVSHAVQMEAHAQVDDLIAGYQMRAVLDEVTRPRHRLRNGRVWHKTDTEPMQLALGMEQASLPDDF